MNVLRENIMKTLKNCTEESFKVVNNKFLKEDTLIRTLWACLLCLTSQSLIIPKSNDIILEDNNNDNSITDNSVSMLLNDVK